MMAIGRWCLALLCLCCAQVQAHRLDEYLQAATVAMAADGVSLRLRLSPGQAVAHKVWAAMDADGDGELSAAEQQAYARLVVDGLTLAVDGRPLALSLVDWSFPARADIERGLGETILNLHAALSVADGPHQLHFASPSRHDISVHMVNTLQPSDGALRITGQRRSADQAVYDLDFTLGAGAGAQTRKEDGGAALAWTYFQRGVWHILTGYDHLLFACALVLGARKLLDLVKVVTAFTLAHSATLLLAACQLLRVPEQVVEPMIAASIVIVALQNVFWPRAAHGAWRLAAAFFFGLFHGLGFAGGLPQLLHTLDGGLLLLAILGFSLGVEAGHQVVMLPLFALTRHARGQQASRLRHAGSALIAAGGAYYLFAALGARA